MRTFEERRAEVFRRSDKRIRERRAAHRRLAAILVPIGVLAAVWGVTALPAMLPAGADGGDPEGNLETFDGAVNGSVGVVSVRVTSSAEDAAAPPEITDAARVTALHCAILDLYNEVQAGASGNEVGGGNSENKGEAGRPQTVPPVYTIRFVYADGSYGEYRLYADCICDVGGGTSLALTGAQIEEIKALMGVSE